MFKLHSPGWKLAFQTAALMSPIIFFNLVIESQILLLRKVMNGGGFKACWLSGCVHPEGKLKFPRMHNDPWVKGTDLQTQLSCSLCGRHRLSQSDLSCAVDGSITTERFCGA